MSPEQAKGKSVDKRADIWAFGCILYECLTGKRAFDGETATETLAAVIKEEPDIEKAPIKAQRLLYQCLAKERKNRLRDIGDATTLLEFPSEDAFVAAPLKHSWLWKVIAAVFLLTTLLVGLLLFIPEAPLMADLLQFQIVLPEKVTTSPQGSFSLSPDGTQFAYSTPKGIYIRYMNEPDARPITGTDEDAQSLFFSPDGQSIGYFSMADQS